MSTNWEQQYLEGVTPWEKGEASPGLVDYLEANEVRGRVIAPGCGLGHDVRVLAASSGRPEVIGLDVAPSAVRAAREFPVAGGEQYAQGDWFDLPAKWQGAFDWIWEHTCFCAIEPSMRQAYVDAAHLALRPGGSLLGVFYLDPYDDEHQPGGGPPHGVEENDLLEHLTAAGRFEMVERWVPESTYPGREGRELMLRLERSA